MKIKKLSPKAGEEVGTVEITHSQSIKQSANYQSADVSYGVRLVVRDTPKDIKRGIKRAEELVEDALVPKVREQAKVLEALVK